MKSKILEFCLCSFMLNKILISSNMVLIEHVKADGATSCLKHLDSEYLFLLKSGDMVLTFYETWDEN